MQEKRIADPDQPRTFPEGFVWGTATAGHQIEGGNVHSNWWEWEKEGLVDDGSTSGQACDYWNRFHEDHDLMVSLGHQMFRLGVEWSRVEPEDGRFDDGAIDHYREMLADLQDKGIKVCLTLNHWVIPQWFADQDSWLGANAISKWERFVRKVVPAFAAFVDIWVTLNEPMVPVLAGYLGGYHPPAEANPIRAARVFNRLLEAHAVAYHTVHSLVPRSPSGDRTMVGYANAYQHVEPFHEAGWKRPAELAASKAIAWAGFDAWDHAVRTGRSLPPWGRGQRMEQLARSYDFVGVNYYMRISARLHAKAISNVKSGEFDVPDGIETTGMGWQVYPPGLRHVLHSVSKHQKAPIYITENGCCDIACTLDDPGPDEDGQRRSYLLSHLSQVQRAIAEGVDVRGYLLWCFVDNFEWREGFAKRFGIVAMDHDDPELTRRPRKSAAMYRQIIEANAVTPEIVEEFSPGALDRWG